MPSFEGASGRRWSYDADKSLGPPGSFGEVFLASDGQYEFAVKQIPLRVGDRRGRQRERELEIAQKLTSGDTLFRHLLIPIDWGTLGEDLLLVMPRAEYSLAEVILSGSFSTENRYRAIREVALGLSELSSAGVLHRDLKPSNVLWLQEAWRLSDFGISRDIGASTATYTFKGAGSLPYMAPEVWELRPATEKADLYALGVLAYEVLTGSRPFNGPKPEDLERQHRQEVAPSLQINDGRMSRLITRLLSKDPASRPQDAQTVVDVIDSSMRRLDSAREEVAASAAALAGALSQREAEASKQARGVEVGKQALSELHAFLEDVADDMRDVFPSTRFTEEDGYCQLQLDPAEILFIPIKNLSKSYPESASAILACSVFAALPDKASPPRSIDTWYIPGFKLIANLICDLINNRLEWTIVTFERGGGLLPCGQHQNVIDLRAEGLRGSSLSRFQSVPLNTDGMMWLVRHAFESLSHEDDYEDL